jgi:5-methylcytosine-specific restriction endonuclease McrA
MSNRVFVLDDDRKPLAPCSPARARELLHKGKASVFRRYPFTITLNRKIPQSDIGTEHLTLKVDPGSKTTGIAIVLEGKYSTKCVFGLNLIHRGQDIVNKLISRTQTRKVRRSRNTRYRKPRFLIRTKPKGWIPPSLQSRVNNIQTWSDRLLRLCRLDSSAVETVSFDTQKMENPDISGKEYQQGTLHDFEVKEYLLHRYNHTCQYCNGVSKDYILEREHIYPRSKGGSNRLSNLTLSCRSCNLAKNAETLEDWLAYEKLRSSKLNKARVVGIERVMKGVKPPLRDATAATIVSQRTVEYLSDLGLRPEIASGYQTKYNRTKQGYRKDHWIDAACVGVRGIGTVIPKKMACLTAKAQKCNNRQMCLSDKYGFPRTSPKGPSTIYGFSTGDSVKANAPSGKYAGTWNGRVAVRSTGFFDIHTSKGVVTVNYKTCKVMHKRDGYSYTKGTVYKLNVIMFKIDSLKQNLKKLGITVYKLISISAIDSVSFMYNLEIIK